MTTLVPYVVAGLFLACLFIGECNLMSLEDKTARSLGLNVNATRIVISLIAVLLASISTAIAGAISFLGLIVPHIGRILVGSDHRHWFRFLHLREPLPSFWQIPSEGPLQLPMRSVRQL